MTLAPRQPPGTRPAYRPPIGIPAPRQSTVGSVVASVVLHAIIVFLLLGPIIARDLIVAASEGAGGKGPAGGGGGGGNRRLEQERATFVEVAPAKEERPQVVPRPVVKPPDPQVPPPPADPLPLPAATVPTAGATTDGSGSGAGGGAGPGSGGGTGSGEGAGRGSGTGPGTGGGTAKVYPPTVTHLAMLPLPVPAKVRPYTLVAVFEVDERGNARLLHFNESRDKDYNRKIRAMLDEIRFRPAVRADGTPVRDTTSIIAEARI